MEAGRLGIRGSLKQTLASTNPCESMIECVRRTSRVKRWHQARWRSAGPPPACSKQNGKFRRIIDYHDFAKLALAIETRPRPHDRPVPD
jgi:hypothetical protein